MEIAMTMLTNSVVSMSRKDKDLQQAVCNVIAETREYWLAFLTEYDHALAEDFCC